MDSAIRADLSEDRKEEIVFSSAATIGRTEAPSDHDADDVVQVRRRLHEVADIAYGNTIRWIEEEALDAIVCYNGRMAATRAVIEACRDHNVPFVTYERSWLGNGLRLIPGANCLSLDEMGRVVEAYADVPLSARQARFAGWLAAQRFLVAERPEWRVYNPDPQATSWPGVGSGPRTLILPSSRNEFAGHPEWTSDWDDYTRALDALLEVLPVSPEDCVLRCHPNWAEKIGKRDGRRSERHYLAWANRNRVHAIRSGEKANTYDLIGEANLIVVNGSSTGAEAALIGKPVVCLGPAPYARAGFSTHLTRWDDFEELDLGSLLDAAPGDQARKALRYLYSRARRFPQYVDEVEGVSALEYRYYEGGNPGCIESMLRTDRVPVYDKDVGDSSGEEDEVVEQMLCGRWSALHREEGRPWADSGNRIDIGRRPWLRWVDSVRGMLPRGDR